MKFLDQAHNEIYLITINPIAMKNKILLTLILLFFGFNNCKDGSNLTESKNTKGIFVDFNGPEKVKKQIRKKDKYFLAAYNALIDKC